MKKFVSIFLILLISTYFVISQNTDTYHKSIITSRNLVVDGEIIDTLSHYHELTIFVINTPSPLNWESPAMLYHTVKKAYLKTIIHPLQRPFGHMAFCFQSTLLERPLWMGIIQKKERKKYHLNLIQKLGLGVLAYPFHAKLEDKSILESSLRYNVKKNHVRVISFRLNDESAHRMLDFLTAFVSENSLGYISGDFYGGVFWPLYEGEGAGCSALCMSVLEAGGIKIDDQEQWKIELNIPMELIGEDSSNNQVNILTKIKQADSWYEQSGTPNKDYVQFEIYAPHLVFQWINEQMKTAPKYMYHFDNEEIPGLLLDYRNIDIPQDPVIPLKQRNEYSFFLKNFAP